MQRNHRKPEKLGQEVAHRIRHSPWPAGIYLHPARDRRPDEAPGELPRLVAAAVRRDTCAMLDKLYARPGSLFLGRRPDRSRRRAARRQRPPLPPSHLLLHMGFRPEEGYAAACRCGCRCLPHVLRVVSPGNKRHQELSRICGHRALHVSGDRVQSPGRFEHPRIPVCVSHASRWHGADHRPVGHPDFSEGRRRAEEGGDCGLHRCGRRVRIAFRRPVHRLHVRQDDGVFRRRGLLVCLGVSHPWHPSRLDRRHPVLGKVLVCGR